MNKWSRVCFGELFDLVYRYPTYYGIEYTERGIKEIRGELLTSNGRIIDEYRFVSPDTAARFPKIRLKEGDFVMSVRGTLGKIGLVESEQSDAVITANLIRLSPARALADSSWLRQVLMSEHFQEQLDNVCSQTTIKTIQVPKLLKIPVDHPPLSEQRKIAKILTTVDNLIEKTEALIAKYQAIKQGMMHDLFTRGVDAHGHLRPPYDEAPELYKESELGWIPREWEVALVDHVLERIIDYRGKTPTKTDSGIPLITAKNVRMGFIDEEPKEFISEREYDSWMTRGIPLKGDVLFTTEAPLGNVAQITTDQ